MIRVDGIGDLRGMPFCWWIGGDGIGVELVDLGGKRRRWWHQGDSIGGFGMIAPVDTGRRWKFHRYAEVTGEGNRISGVFN